MEESILLSIKKLLGPSGDYDHFDPDIIIHINTYLMALTQMGVGPAKGFRITGDTETWSEFLPDEDNLEAVKTYVYAKVKLIFDPPLSSSVVQSLEKVAAECEWRISVTVDPWEDVKEGIQNEV